MTVRYSKCSTKNMSERRAKIPNHMRLIIILCAPRKNAVARCNDPQLRISFRRENKFGRGEGAGTCLQSGS
jgi:hypothetical protein